MHLGNRDNFRNTLTIFKIIGPERSPFPCNSFDILLIILIEAIGPRNRKLAVLEKAKYTTSGMFMVEVYGKKASQIYAQDPAHRRTYTWVNVQRSQCKESKGRKERKKKNFQSQRREFEPTTLTLQGKASPIATFILHKDPLLQLLYEYHEGYILNSIAISNAHEGEREKVL